MKLFHYPQTCATACNIILEETGAPFYLHTVNIMQDEHRTKEYLAINPKGKIPALEVDGNIITENVAIQYYLAKRFPEKNLCPSDPLLEAEWLSVISFISNSLHIAAALITKTFHYADDESVYPSLRRKGASEFRKFLKMLDERLEDHDWLVGDRYSTADAYLMAYVPGFRMFEVPVAEIPNIKKWVGRMLKREAVKRVLENENSLVLQMEELLTSA